MASKKGAGSAANNVPGPGQYNPSVDASKENLGGVRIGTGPRSNLNPGNKEIPGPGSYNISNSLRGPTAGFGSSTRRIAGTD